ncbi:hypothetical protein MEQU1_003235 [Malassezia equina]|uniref:Uncharacterized protein n=1 Tax=Malassezia equina TaxID=1381935 RepID=A0AAF0J1J1_9BASI|nr:hypothetical protein MEQU1_003235 [Malassezia equina]
MYGDDREPWTLPPGRYPVYEGSTPREIPHPGLSRLPVPVVSPRPMGVARRGGGAQGVPEAQQEVPEAQQGVPEAQQEGEVPQQEAHPALQVAPVTHQEAHQAHQEATQDQGQAQQQPQLAHQEGQSAHQDTTQVQGQAQEVQAETNHPTQTTPPTHHDHLRPSQGAFSGDSSLSDPPSDLSVSEGSESQAPTFDPTTDRDATPEERACFPRGVPPSLAERVRTVGALAAHRQLATAHIEEVLIELQNHGLDTDEGLLALYLQVVASRTVYTALPGKWQRSMRKALDGLCAYQVQHGSHLVELMILLLPKLGVFPGLAQSQTDDERDAELARLEAYPGPQWKALIQQTVERGVGAILADFLEGWGGPTEGEAHAQEAAQQRVGDLVYRSW